MMKKLHKKFFNNWDEKLKVWKAKLAVYARASSYAIHR
jgi:putative component of toxin-antitoxin plasmid stabilization module